LYLTRFFSAILRSRSIQDQLLDPWLGPIFSKQAAKDRSEHAAPCRWRSRNMPSPVRPSAPWVAHALQSLAARTSLVLLKSTDTPWSHGFLTVLFRFTDGLHPTGGRFRGPVTRKFTESRHSQPAISRQQDPLAHLEKILLPRRQEQSGHHRPPPATDRRRPRSPRPPQSARGRRSPRQAAAQPIDGPPAALAAARPCPTRPAVASVSAFRARPRQTLPTPAPSPPWGQRRKAALPRLPASPSCVLDRRGCHKSSQPLPEKLIIARNVTN
jgi:hypothetical protein